MRVSKRSVAYQEGIPVIPEGFPKIVTLCGSTRFKEEYERVWIQLGMKGIIVLSVVRFGHLDGLDMQGYEKLKLDELHFRKIDLSDGIFVINHTRWQCLRCHNWYDMQGDKSPDDCECGCGSFQLKPYVGHSTANEIKYAQEHGKEVVYLNPMPGEKRG